MNSFYEDALVEVEKRVIEHKHEGKLSIYGIEQTKLYYVQPFLESLGYGFKPEDVDLGFVCDSKKNLVVDYALKVSSVVRVLVKCKACNTELTDADYKYIAACWAASSAVNEKLNYIILTNGVVYKFYTAMNKDGILDKTPFCKIDLSQAYQDDHDELRSYARSEFLDFYSIVSPAKKLTDLKKEFEEYLTKQLQSPSEAFIKFIKDELYVFNMSLEDIGEVIKSADFGSSAETKKKVERTAKGVSGTFTLEELLKMDFAGSTLKGIIVKDENHFEINKFSQLVPFFFDYWTSSEVDRAAIQRVLDTGLVFGKPKEGYKNYHGLYYNGANQNALTHCKNFQKLMAQISVSADEIEFVLEEKN